MSHYFALHITCPHCNQRTVLKFFAYSTSKIMFTTWCGRCEKNLYLEMEPSTLQEWASRADNQPTVADAELLHDLHIRWEDDATGHR
jgi:transcription elongation factor Elf1